MAVEAVIGLVGVDRGDRPVDCAKQAIEFGAVMGLARGILLRLENPKILVRDDAEVVRDLVAEAPPFFGDTTASVILKSMSFPHEPLLA